MTKPSIKSTFAILDVKAGRKALAKRFASAPRLGECPKDLRLPVIVKGYIDGAWSGDDGISQEFTVTVTSVETRK